MRYFIGLALALALSVMGCSETAGTGGSGGSAGTGGMPECLIGSDCDDGNQCTSDWCTDGICEFRERDDGTSCAVGPQSTPWGEGLCIAGSCRVLCETAEDCADFNECTAEMCTPFDGDALCDFTPVADQTPCAGGTCQSGSCDLAGSVLPCTEQGIRNAIAAGGGPYTFDCDGPQSIVPERFIVIDNSVILDGESKLTLDGDSAPDLLVVLENVSAELRRLTVTGGGNGPCDELSDNCAGIANWGTLALANVTLTDNGVGVLNGGTLTMTSCTVSENERNGIFNAETLTLTNSTVSGNGGDSGNGIFNGGNLTLMGVTLSGNETGVRSEGPTGPERNRLIVTNSTISGNAGYGIVSGQSETVITYTTIAENGFWGLWNGGSDLVGHGPMTVTKSIVADDCEDGPITSDGYNIESTGDTCGFDQGSDQVNVTAEQLGLGPLQDHGGPTMTHALEAGSVAIDRIPAVDCEVTTDQRGQPRPETGGDACDAGSFERQPEDP